MNVGAEGPLPAEFAGAWQRTDLRIGGELRDDADVLWLQTTEWYADLRIPHDDHGGAIEAFAGPARWVEPYFTWLHQIDWVGSFPDDVGHLTWDGSALIETGWFECDPKDKPYEERWVPCQPASPRLAAVRSTIDRRAAHVRVGHEAITLVDDRPAGGGFAAAPRSVRRSRLGVPVLPRHRTRRARRSSVGVRGDPRRSDPGRRRRAGRRRGRGLDRLRRGPRPSPSSFRLLFEIHDTTIGRAAIPPWEER